VNKAQAKRTKYTCYFTSFAMASVFGLPPILFSVFQSAYNISYTLLGTLVLINFCTQLGVDLIFSFFSKRFNIHKTIRIMPFITAFGLCVYAIIPTIFPNRAYVGLVIGTIIFSLAAGLNEVLTSPLIAALPSDTPDKDMSALHSIYGYGLTSVVVISTLFVKFVGKNYWNYLTLLWAILPIIAWILLMKSKLPEMSIGQVEKGKEKSKHRTVGLSLCVICIFLGACAENTMSNWISAFAEKALNIPKMYGDVFGMALFAVLLALTRTAYAKFGKNIFSVIAWSMFGSVLCYILAAVSPNAVVSLIACVALGICTSMLWPGTLILMEEKIPRVGVAAYALMAAGGDFGASFAPQLFGIIIDNVAVTDWAISMSNTFAVTPEQVGFKVGILVVTIFPILGLVVLGIMKKHFNKENKKSMLDGKALG